MSDKLERTWHDRLLWKVAWASRSGAAFGGFAIMVGEIVDNGERTETNRIVVTDGKNPEPGIDCATCRKLLAQYDFSTGLYSPSAEELFSAGAVPVPNFGWFCGQSCADDYGHKFNVSFQRNQQGEVEYYPEGLS